MNSKDVFPERRSTLRRVFFTPVDQRKFEQLRTRNQEQMMRVDLFNLR